MFLWFSKAFNSNAQPATFQATGPTQPVQLDPAVFGQWKKPAVAVAFDLLPIEMRFYPPSFPCLVSENGIRYSNFWVETYDPRISEGSFEPLMDSEYKYVRMWIESQNEARIVVRVRYALCDWQGNIAHSDIHSGSPYGKGDWVDEWYYIYPDGVHIRYVKVYTGLASRSKPFGFDRDPPEVIHEFMESAVLNGPGHLPTDDIEIGALTLIKIVGGHSEVVIPGGKSKTIYYKPYPNDFGDFRDANIMVINLKARYKPFTIALPYGVKVQPYMPEDDLPFVFQTWGNPLESGYACSLGHILNFWHYRRTEKTLEQIYLSGMTAAKEPAGELVPLAWSWIIPARLIMPGLKPNYQQITYDRTQKAWIIPPELSQQSKLDFKLEVDKEFYDGVQVIVNPVIIVKGWGKSKASISINGKTMVPGRHFRVGYQEVDGSKDFSHLVKTSFKKVT